MRLRKDNTTNCYKIKQNKDNTHKACKTWDMSLKSFKIQPKTHQHKKQNNNITNCCDSMNI